MVSMVFEILRALVNDGLEANNVLRLQCTAMNIKDDWQWQVRLYNKINCDCKEVSFLLKNTVSFIDLRRPLTSSMVFRRPLKISMVLKRPLEIFNGF